MPTQLVKYAFTNILRPQGAQCGLYSEYIQ